MIKVMQFVTVTRRQRWRHEKHVCHKYGHLL